MDKREAGKAVMMLYTHLVTVIARTHMANKLSRRIDPYI